MFSAAHFVLWGGISMLVYVGVVLCVHRFGSRPVLWCVPLALLLAGTYALNLVDLRHGTIYSGIGSDQSLNLAYTGNVIAGNYTGDYFDKHVPSQYSPLYFWVVGTLARVLGQTQLEIWRWFPLAMLAALPFLVHFVGTRLGGQPICGFYAAFALLVVGSCCTAMSFGMLPYEISPHALMLYLLLKPHESLAAILLVAWVAALARGPTVATATRAWALRAIALGALVFLLYAPWFAIGAAALVLLGIAGVPWTTRRGYFARLLSVLAACAALGAVHWLPYALALLRTRARGTHITEFFRFGQLDPTWVTLGMGYCGALFLLGVLGLAWFRRDPAVRALTIAVCLAYVWYASTYLTYPLFGFSFLPHRCHELLVVLLAFASALAMQKIAQLERGKRFVAPLALSLLAALLGPNLVRWNAMTDPLLARARLPLSEQAASVTRMLDARGQPTVAATMCRFSMELAALSHARLYFSPMPAFANPAAQQDLRLARLREAVARATTGAELGKALDALGIDVLVLAKTGGPELRLNYWVGDETGDLNQRSLAAELLRPRKKHGKAPSETQRIVFRAELLRECCTKTMDTREVAVFVRNARP